MSAKKKQPGYDDTDLEIALCLGLGITWDETARIVGVTKPTISNRLKGNNDWMQMVVSIARRIKAAKLDEVVADTQDAMKRELNKLRPKIIQAYKDGVEDPDVLIRMTAADKVLDRVDGKSTQKLETVGVMQHQVVALPSAELSFLMKAVGETRRQLEGDVDGVIEAEVLPGG